LTSGQFNSVQFPDNCQIASHIQVFQNSDDNCMISSLAEISYSILSKYKEFFS